MAGLTKSSRPVTRTNTTPVAKQENLVRTIGENYEDVQKRTLIKWVNSYLRQVGDGITSIETDLKDGKRLLKLLALISNTPAPKPEKFSMRIHQMANVSNALTFLEKQMGEPLGNIGNEDIVNGDVKKTLSLLWRMTIYQMQQQQVKYDIGGNPEIPSQAGIIDDGKATTSKGSELRSNLLAWVRSQLVDYQDVIRLPQDFSRSWRNGLALALLIHRHDPSLIPNLFDDIVVQTRDRNTPEQWRENLQNAFSIAEERMGVSRLLEPEDLADVDFPDEPSVMMYISQMFEAMSKAQIEEDEDKRRQRAEERRKAREERTRSIGQAKDLGGPIIDEAEAMGVITEEFENHDEEMFSSEPSDIITDQAVNGGIKGQEEAVRTPPTPLAISPKPTDPTPTSSNGSVKSRSSYFEKLPSSPSPRPAIPKRASTLGLEDTVRIKTELEDRLRKQLAGVLPRGVDPILDAFLNGLDAATSSLREQQRALPEVPSIVDVVCTPELVNQYIRKTDNCQQRYIEKTSILDEIQNAKKKLLEPPETEVADVFKLTNEQKRAVEDMSANIFKDWKTHGDHIQDVKTRLLTLSDECTECGRIGAEFKLRADQVDEQIKLLIEQLMEMVPVRNSNRTFESGSRATTPSNDSTSSNPFEATTPNSFADQEDSPRLLHPLQSNEEDVSSFSDAYIATSQSLMAFNEIDWAEFSELIETFSEGVRQLVLQRLNETHSAYNEMTVLHEARGRDLELFKRGHAFSRALREIRDQLDDIQAKMVKGGATKDTGMTDLEESVSNGKIKIEKLREEYKDLLEPVPNEEEEDYDGVPTITEFGRGIQYETYFDKLVAKSDLVESWVEEVRVWFVEAERVQEWIQVRIDLLEGMPKLDPHSEESSESLELVDKMNDDHEELQQAIDGFNARDMMRLREHVKSLTSFDRKGDLSPADTTTIEIALTTNLTRDRLMGLLQKRTYDLELATLRVQWEHEYEKVASWMADKNRQVQGFVRDKARWKPSEMLKEEPTSPDSELQSPTFKKEQIRDEAIQGLLGIERSVMEFDQGIFTATQDIFQRLDDLSEIELPDHLEMRQTKVEIELEELQKRVSFSRQTVEQRLAVMDFMKQGDELQWEADILIKDLTNAELKCKLGDSDKEFTERVQRMQQRCLDIVTVLAGRIVYPNAPHPDDVEDNNSANELIKDAVSDRKNDLIASTEKLNEKLESYRRILALHKRTKAAMDKAARLGEWIQDRVKLIKKHKVDPFTEKCTHDEDDVARLERDRDQHTAKIEEFKETDMAALRAEVDQILELIDTYNAVSIDKEALLGALAGTTTAFGDMQNIFSSHVMDLDVLKRRVAWESQHNKCSQWTSSTNRKLWEWIDKEAQWRPTRQSLANPSRAEDESLRKSLLTFQHRLGEFNQNQLSLNQSLFEHLCEGFNLLRPGEENPLHVVNRQTALKDNVAKVTELTEFGGEVFGQRVAAVDYLSKAKDLRSDAESLHKAINNSIANVMEDPNVIYDQQIREISQTVKQIWETYGTNVPYPECPASALATKPTIGDEDINTEIKESLFKTNEELEALGKELQDANDAYLRAVELKGLANQYKAEAEELNSWLAARTKELAAEKVNPLADNVSTTKQEVKIKLDWQAQAVAEIDIFQSEKIASLQAKFKSLEEDIAKAGAKTVNLSSLTEELKTMDNSFQNLKSQHDEHLANLNALEKRVAWEATHLAGIQFIDNLQEGLRDLTVKKDSVLAGREEMISSTAVDELKAELSEITELLNHFTKGDLISIRTNMDEYTQACAQMKNNPQVPDSVATRMQNFEKAIARLQETVDNRSKELSILGKRAEWESAAEAAMQRCTAAEETINDFIRHDGRWQKMVAPGERPTQEELEQELEEFIEKLAAYENGTIKPLMEQYAELDSLSKGNPSLLPEHVRKRRNSLSEIITRLNNHKDFASQVIVQRRATLQYVEIANELEKKAESLKEQLLSSAARLPEHDKKVQNYDIETANLRDAIAAAIPYPTRTYNGLLPSDRVTDENANAVIKETINSRSSLLSDLVTSLHDLLESNDRLSRRKMGVQSYMKQAEDVRSWIIPRAELVQKESMDNGNVLNSSETIRECLGRVEGVVAAVKAYEPGYKSLKTSCDRIISDMLAELNEDTIEHEKTAAIEDAELMRTTQAKVDELWDSLWNEAPKVKKSLRATLRVAEYMERVDRLLQAAAQMQEEIAGMDPKKVQDEDLNRWQEQYEQFEQYDLVALQKLIQEENKGNLDAPIEPEDAEIMASKLGQAEERLNQLKKSLVWLYQQAKSHRLSKTYFDNAQLLEDFMTECNRQLVETKEQKGIVVGASDDADRKRYHDLVTAFKAIRSDIMDHKDQFDDLCSYHKFIRTQTVDSPDDIDARQLTLETKWTDLQNHADKTQNFVGRVGHWFEFHSAVGRVEDEVLTGIKARVDKLIATGWDAPEPEIRELNERITMATAMLEDVRMHADAMGVEHQDPIDEQNRKAFDEHHEKATSNVLALASSFQAGLHAAHRASAFAAFRKNCEKMQSACRKQTEAINERVAKIKTSGFYILEEEAIEKMARKGMTAFLSSEQEYARNKHEISGPLTQDAEKLMSEYQFEETKVQEILNRATTSLVEFGDAVEAERLQLELMRKIYSHSKTAGEIMTWITGCERSIDNIPTDAHEIDEADQRTEIEELENRIKEFKPTVDSFKDLLPKILHDIELAGDQPLDPVVINKQSTTKEKKPQTIVEKRLQQFTEKKPVSVKKPMSAADKKPQGSVNKKTTGKKVPDVKIPQVKVTPPPTNMRESVEQRVNVVEEKWDELVASLASTKLLIENNRLALNIARKMKEIMNTIGDIKERILLIMPEKSSTSPAPNQQSEKDAFAAESALDAIDAEIQTTLRPKIELLEKMIVGLDDKEGVVSGTNEIFKAMNDLTSLLELKRGQINDALRIGGFLSLADELDVLMGGLLEAVEAASPHHARVIDNSLSKTDLQAMLIELDAKYRYYEPLITQKLETTVEASANLMDDWRVEERLASINEQWAELQALAGTRREELQRYIDKLNMPVLNTVSLANRTPGFGPTSPKRRVPIGGTPTKKPRPPVTQPVTTSPSVRSRVNSRPTLAPSSASRVRTPSLSQRPSTLSRSTRKLNKYVPDKNNELDMEVARIVNDLDFEVAFKAVPNEVGKYWFGEQEPKLCYCRILKSKMVMVRVGGGWMELSRFLGDHNNFERNRPPSMASIYETMEFGANLDWDDTKSVQSDASSSGTGFLSIGGTPKRSPTSERAKSPGYKEGDQFFTVDAEGNRHAIKMTKVKGNPHATPAAKRR